MQSSGVDPLAALGDLVVQGIEKAQVDKNKGVYYLDVQRGINEVCSGKLPPPTELHLAVLLAYKQGRFRASRDFAQYSNYPIEGFKTLQEWLESNFKGYTMDDAFLFINKGAPKLNFKNHMELLLQPAGVENEEIDRFEKTLEEWGPMFLDGELLQHVIFASFPRSGNTFTRKYLESITGIVTGSDNHTLMSLLSLECSLPGFKGELQVDNKVWVNKTHFPIALPLAAKHKGSKALVCIRDPLDASISAFNLVYTLTQNRSCSDEVYTQFQKEWYGFVDQGSDGWFKWSDYWREVSRTEKIPVHFFRFEDLKDRPRETLMGIFAFLLDGREIKGTVLEQRIIKATTDASSSVLYKPRLGKAVHDTSKFSQEFLDRSILKMAETAYFYGYSDPNDQYCVYPPEEQHEGKENWKTSNEKTLKKLIDNEYKLTQLPVNAPATGFKLEALEPAYFVKVQKVQLHLHIQEDK